MREHINTSELPISFLPVQVRLIDKEIMTSEFLYAREGQ